jgi:hypothetical protein
MSEPTPEFLDSKKVFEGRVFDVTVDTVREGDKTYVKSSIIPAVRLFCRRSTMARSLSCGSTGIRLCVTCSNSRPAH